jgi:branched-chain amino acid transport system ATP-binding protein
MNLSENFILKGTSIGKRFGGLQALQEVNFNVQEGTIFAVIGPNGAGKTTLFNLITGVERRFEGEFVFKGTVISGTPSHSIANAGVARTFQNVRLFKNLSVLQNVMVGCHGWICPTYFRTVFNIRASNQQENTIRNHAFEMLTFVGMEKKANDQVDSLPLGEQKLLEIARALAAKPRLLLLDEPGAGLNDAEMNTLKEIIFKIREHDITQMIVEHNMKLIMSISERIMVLNFGLKIAEGTPQEILNNERVIEVYLGKEKKNA